MPIATSSIDHVRLTVSDIEASRKFYEAVFGWPIYVECPENADEATRQALWFLFGGVLYRVSDTQLVGLRPVGEDGFHEDRCGLDHLAFTVPDRAALEAAAVLLDELGVAHEPIKDLGVMAILEFRDPDNIALELVAHA
ncbi:VOC family protein [Nocardia yamanashiensis]|uniref:VOC family protein n=1 Tax=Nocardia yamanashiensis TaxID=209247 RepID=UPI0008338AAA|nr:VOC family protein [Nocardia yamanashiensis]